MANKNCLRQSAMGTGTARACPRTNSRRPWRRARDVWRREERVTRRKPPNAPPKSRRTRRNRRRPGRNRPRTTRRRDDDGRRRTIEHLFRWTYGDDATRRRQTCRASDAVSPTLPSSLADASLQIVRPRARVFGTKNTFESTSESVPRRPRVPRCPRVRSRHLRLLHPLSLPRIPPSLVSGCVPATRSKNVDVMPKDRSQST